MRVRAYPGGGFAENGYLVECSDGEACVVVDPGATAPDMVSELRRRGVEPEAVLLTHAHLDHFEGVHFVREAFPDVPIWLHPAELGMYRALGEQAAAFGLSVPAQPDPDHELAAGQRFTFGSCGFDVRFTPGHAPGHVIFHAPDAGLALVGDVVFLGSIGRTDLPGGDLRTLMRSIREQVLTLPDETVLHPGHGPSTTVGRERATNPFLVPRFGGELV
ncbi:MAG TPA: MBL fold metallo-hydrolase [Longimicrobiales bacterium]|nr:MBL fold metallo-hydrolase [Longimicrobiales bacterium]